MDVKYIRSTAGQKCHSPTRLDKDPAITFDIYAILVELNYCNFKGFQRSENSFQNNACPKMHKAAGDCHVDI